MGFFPISITLRIQKTRTSWIITVRVNFLI